VVVVFVDDAAVDERPSSWSWRQSTCRVADCDGTGGRCARASQPVHHDHAGRAGGTRDAAGASSRVRSAAGGLPWVASFTCI